MFQKIKRYTAQLTQQRHDQFANFKGKVRTNLDQKFPKPHKEIDDSHLSTQALSEIVEHTFSPHKIIIFWATGLLFVAIGFLLYHTLSYLYMLIAACILSLALEGVIGFRARFTRSRGVGIFIAYLLFILFLISGFVIIVPFLMSRGTQLLQSLMFHVQTIQADILTQGIDAYVRGLKWLPDFLNDDILRYIKTTNADSLVRSLTDNLGNIVNLSSSYLKTIGGYAVNIF
jgi:predicted PurR-regulated permease PerM